MKSALVRKGSLSRLQGPRSLSANNDDNDNTTSKRGVKTVTFDRTDEVIRYEYETSTTEVSDSSVDHNSLNFPNIDFNADSHNLQEYTPASSNPDGINGLLPDDRPLPSLPSSDSNEENIAYENNGGDVKIPNVHGTKQADSREDVLNAKYKAELLEPLEAPADFDFTNDPLSPSIASAVSPDTKYTVSSLETLKSPVLEKVTLDERMQAVLGNGSGMSPAVNYPNKATEESDDDLDYSFRKVAAVEAGQFADGADDVDEPVTVRSSETLARQDSLQESQRQLPTKGSNLPAPQNVNGLNRTHSRRRKQILAMLDPHGAGLSTRSIGFSTIEENEIAEEEFEETIIESSPLVEMRPSEMHSPADFEKSQEIQVEEFDNLQATPVSPLHNEQVVEASDNATVEIHNIEVPMESDSVSNYTSEQSQSLDLLEIETSLLHIPTEPIPMRENDDIPKYNASAPDSTLNSSESLPALLVVEDDYETIKGDRLEIKDADNTQDLEMLETAALRELSLLEKDGDGITEEDDDDDDLSMPYYVDNRKDVDDDLSFVFSDVDTSHSASDQINEEIVERNDEPNIENDKETASRPLKYKDPSMVSMRLDFGEDKEWLGGYLQNQRLEIPVDNNQSLTFTSEEDEAVANTTLGALNISHEPAALYAAGLSPEIGSYSTLATHNTLHTETSPQSLLSLESRVLDGLSADTSLETDSNDEMDLEDRFSYSPVVPPRSPQRGTGHFGHPASAWVLEEPHFPHDNPKMLPSNSAKSLHISVGDGEGKVSPEILNFIYENSPELGGNTIFEPADLDSELSDTHTEQHFADVPISMDFERSDDDDREETEKDTDFATNYINENEEPEPEFATTTTNGSNQNISSHSAVSDTRVTQSTLSELSIREPSLGENMANTMQSLISSSFSSGSRSGYILRDSGNLIIAKAVRKLPQRSSGYEIVPDGDIFIRRPAHAIPRNRSLPENQHRYNNSVDLGVASAASTSIDHSVLRNSISTDHHSDPLHSSVRSIPSEITLPSHTQIDSKTKFPRQSSTVLRTIPESRPALPALPTFSEAVPNTMHLESEMPNISAIPEVSETTISEPLKSSTGVSSEDTAIPALSAPILTSAISETLSSDSLDEPKSVELNRVANSVLPTNSISSNSTDSPTQILVAVNKNTPSVALPNRRPNFQTFDDSDVIVIPRHDTKVVPQATIETVNEIPPALQASTSVPVPAFSTQSSVYSSTDDSNQKIQKQDIFEKSLDKSHSIDQSLDNSLEKSLKAKLSALPLPQNNTVKDSAVIEQPKPRETSVVDVGKELQLGKNISSKVGPSHLNDSHKTNTLSNHGLLYFRINHIRLSKIPTGFLVTFSIDNGKHCIQTPAMTPTEAGRFSEEYRINVSELPIIVTVRLSKAKSLSWTKRLSYSRLSVSSDGTLGECTLNALCSASRGRKHSAELKCTRKGQKQSDSNASISATCLYLPCVFGEQMPRNMDAAAEDITDLRTQTASLRPRVRGVMKQLGGDVRSKMRFFELDSLCPVLVACSVQTRQPRTLINLERARAVRIIGREMFEIEFAKESLKFSVRDPKEFRTWVDTLTGAIGQPNRPRWLNCVLYEC